MAWYLRFTKSEDWDNGQMGRSTDKIDIPLGLDEMDDYEKARELALRKWEEIKKKETKTMTCHKPIKISISRENPYLAFIVTEPLELKTVTKNKNLFIKKIENFEKKKEEVMEKPKISIKVIEETIPIWEVMIEDANHEWGENFGSLNELKVFLQGVKAGFSFSGIFPEIPEIPMPE